MDYDIGAGILKLIDHTMLTPYSSENKIEGLVDEGEAFGAYGICVLPVYAGVARQRIKYAGCKLRLAAVVDFPFGGETSANRVEEVKALGAVADEVDVVIQIGLLKSMKYGEVGRDLNDVSAAAHSKGMLLKVIIETAYLSMHEKMKACEIVFGSGADFIKTSTGFADPRFSSGIGNALTGATEDDIRMMAEISERVGKKNVGIKASGGIRTYEQAVSLLRASAREPNPNSFRIGTSSTGAIAKEIEVRMKEYRDNCSKK